MLQDSVTLISKDCGDGEEYVRQHRHRSARLLIALQKHGNPVNEFMADPNMWSNEDISPEMRSVDLRLPSDMNLVLSSDQYVKDERFNLQMLIYASFVCEPGTEYLDTNPLDDPGIDDLIKISSQGRSSNIALASPRNAANQSDVFSRLPTELRQIVAAMLPWKDLVNLRIASATFTAIPQSYFQHLVRTQMPWMWELDSLPAKEVNWYGLWCKFSSADGGSGEDEKKRIWGRRQLMQLTERTNRMLDEDETGELQATMYADAMTSGREHIMRQFRALRGIGMWQNDKKATELRGLRNRRRIYGEIERILDRIQEIREVQ